MRKMAARYFALVLFACIFLFSCGGGGQSGEGQQIPDPEEGARKGGFIGNASPCVAYGFFSNATFVYPEVFAAHRVTATQTNFKVQPNIGDNVVLFFALENVGASDTYLAFRNVTGANVFNFSNLDTPADVGWVTFNQPALSASPGRDAVSGASFVEEFVVPDASVAGNWRLKQMGIYSWSGVPFETVDCSQITSDPRLADSMDEKNYDSVVSQSGNAIAISFVDNSVGSSVVYNGATNGNIMLLGQYDNFGGKDVKTRLELSYRDASWIGGNYSISVFVPGGMCVGRGQVVMTRQ